MNHAQVQVIDPLYFRLFELPNRKGDVKKFAMIEAFLKSVATRGIEATNFKILGEDLKTNHSHLSYYFPTKDDLFEATLKWVHGKMQEDIVQAMSSCSDATVNKKLQAYFGAIFGCLHKNPLFGRMLLLSIHHTHFDEKYAQIYFRLKEGAINRISGILSPTKMEKEKLRGIANDIHALVLGNMVSYVGEMQRETVAKLKQRMTNAAEKLIQ